MLLAQEIHVSGVRKKTILIDSVPTDPPGFSCYPESCTETGVLVLQHCFNMKVFGGGGSATVAVMPFFLHVLATDEVKKVTRNSAV